LLKRGVDFYKLRVKAGIAAYELKKYRQAVSHLQKSYSVVPGDTLVSSYYYRALKLSGREDEASLLADQLSPGLLQAVKARKKGIVNEIAVEASLSRNKDFDALRGEVLESDGGISSYRTIERNQNLYLISLGHHLFPHINVNHDFSMRNIDRILQVNSRFNQPVAPHDPSTSQYQYFLNTRYCLMKGWSFSVSGIYIWGKSYSFSPLLRFTGKSDLEQNTLKINDNIVSFGINKESTYLNTSLTAGYGMINGYKQFQSTLSMILYPFGNNNFFIIPDATLHWDEEAGNCNMVFQPQIGIKTDPFWISGEYGSGKIKNFYTGGGKMVYNVPETITGYWGVILTAPIIKSKLNLSARFRQSTKEGTNYVFTDKLASSKKQYTFLDQSVLVTLKWNW